MSYYPYTAWSSETSRERQGSGGGDGGRGGWWKNKKDAIKKPWKRKTGSKEPQPSQGDPWRKERPFGAFPPFMAQLNAGLFERRSSDPLVRRAAEREPATEDAAGDFDLPQYEGQRRPRLDSVFPMQTGSPPGHQGAQNLAVPPGPRAGAAVGRSSSFNTGDKVREKGAGEDEVDGSEEHERKVSADSSASVEDRTLERRRRRMGVVRKIPQLPQRTKVDWNEIHSLPDFGHRRRRPTPVPTPFGRGIFDPLPHHRHNYRDPLSPPRGVLPDHSQWSSPPESNLPTLDEESDSSEIKGFDHFRLY